MKIIQLSILLFLSLIISSCQNGESRAADGISIAENSIKEIKIQPGAERLAEIVPLLKNKRVALVVNQTSIVGDEHLLDTLLSLNVNIVRIFSPEHGVRGDTEAGAKIDDSIDSKTGIQIVSLYGKKRRPDSEDLKDVDVVVFDIQDVGARFYTYITTMGEVMLSCIDNGKRMLVLDRPNPNGNYIDGPVREENFKSYVAYFPIPVVYGMTIGELALMANGEHWLSANFCDLKVIKCINYTHQSYYELPVAPSPNLPDALAVELYPSLCFFEGTTVNEGRGTDKPFQQIGHPLLKGYYEYSYTPVSMKSALNPRQKDKLCYGTDFSSIPAKNIWVKGKIDLSYLIDFYNKLKGKGPYFLENNWIDKLAGTDSLRKMIVAGKSEEEIRNSWQPDIDKFRVLREKYLLYE